MTDLPTDVPAGDTPADEPPIGVSVERTEAGWIVTVTVDEVISEEQRQAIQEVADAAAHVLDSVEALVEALRGE